MGGDIIKERPKEELIDNEYGIWLYFKKSIIISTTLGNLESIPLAPEDMSYIIKKMNIEKVKALCFRKYISHLDDCHLGPLEF